MSTSARLPVQNSERLWAIGFGLFLGLAILKFGNPVVLEARIQPPQSFAEVLHQPWPLRGAFVGFALIAALGLPWLGRRLPDQLRRTSKYLWVPLALWGAWQTIAASRSVDGSLTSLTLFQFAGILLAYAYGLTLLSDRRILAWSVLGVLLGLCLCLMRANTQRWVEFPSDRAMLLEGERTGWTNFPAAALESMKVDGLIIHTNGVDVANPVILSKLQRGRVHGTLVYPNALAGAILLVLPVGLYLVWTVTREQRPLIRWAAFGLLAYLGGSALLWSGSKSGWLIALAMGVTGLMRLNVSRRFKVGLLVLVVGAGLLVFGLRFQGYFAAGATSVEARFDYWRAAVQIAVANPGT
ncbi:MAG TPA: O-antigen ligase family protein, partial [Verrucomicrobiota bacterium]|nr:O-antigen ligase family protein [Verrucomicrobiota bacterium]